MTWIFDARRSPIELPDPPRISRADADLIYRADVTMAAWLKMTDKQRADLRFNTPAIKGMA